MVNAPRSIKRNRRTRAAIGVLEDAFLELIEREQPMTCRQVFYRAVSAGLIDKDEKQYKGTVIRLLSNLRRAGRLPYRSIADNTRWTRRPASHNSLADMLDESQRLYRRNLWQDQDDYVEIWCEKDALAGVMSDVTYKWNVPLMVSRGFASDSYLYEAAQNLIAAGKPAHVYLFTDYDPSGIWISKTIESRLAELAPDADLHFHRVAVTEDQIRQWDLPTRPTKTTDSRSKGFSDESVDLDAIPPDQLRQLVESSIVGHIDGITLGRHDEIEEAERETLANWIEGLGDESDQGHPH